MCAHLPLHQRTTSQQEKPCLSFSIRSLEHSLEQTSPCPRSTQQQFGSLRTVEPGIWYFLRHQSQRRAVLFSAVPVGIPARVGGDQQRSLGCSGKYGAFDLQRSRRHRFVHRILLDCTRSVRLVPLEERLPGAKDPMTPLQPSRGLKQFPDWSRPARTPPELLSTSNGERHANAMQ